MYIFTTNAILHTVTLTLHAVTLTLQAVTLTLQAVTLTLPRYNRHSADILASVLDHFLYSSPKVIHSFTEQIVGTFRCFPV